MKNALTFSVALVGIIALLALHQTLPGDTLFAALSRVKAPPTTTAKEVISKKPEDRTGKTIPPQFSLVANFNRQIKDLSAKVDKTPDDLKSIDRLKSERAQLMPELIKADPNLAFALVSPDIDQALSVRSGIVDVFITDDFDHPENSKTEYFLTQGRTREQFFPANTSPGGLALMSNTKVNIPQAYRFGDLIIADARSS